MSESETPAAKRLLVVDDEDDVRNLVCRILKDVGYAVESAVDGADAIEKLEKGTRPDLIVLDLMMPGIDGWGVLAHLRTRADSPPVLVLTARSDYETFTRGVKDGAAGFVAKPFRLQELVASCQRVLLGRTKVEPPTEEERRREPRRSLAVELKLLLGGNSPTTLGELVNLSRSGAQVDIDTPLSPGELLKVAFHIPGGGSTLTLECQVQWWRGSASRGVAHGLKFLNLTPDGERQIVELIGRPAEETTS